MGYSPWGHKELGMRACMHKPQGMGWGWRERERETKRERNAKEFSVTFSENSRGNLEF